MGIEYIRPFSTANINVCRIQHYESVWGVRKYSHALTGLSFSTHVTTFYTQQILILHVHVYTYIHSQGLTGSDGLILDHIQCKVVSCSRKALVCVEEEGGQEGLVGY